MPVEICIDKLSEYAEQVVSLRGWLAGVRSAGKLIFLLLRDGTGTCQCLVEAAKANAFQIAGELTLESSFAVTGVVRLDPRAPGGFELAVLSVVVIQKAEPFPITRKAHGIDFLMNHRHLWLRSRRQVSILRIRHTLIQSIRDFFNGRGFTLVDTPILIRQACEGAGTLFPVDFFGEQAYLTQTGQLHLECACMALGKVYSFGPTFRAEKSKTRRHLVEFWMVEPEVAFADLDDVIQLAQDLVVHICGTIAAAHGKDLQVLGCDCARLEKIALPFPRMTYTQAVELLRSPDVAARLEQELADGRQQLQQLVDELGCLESRRTSVKAVKQREKIDNQVALLRENIRELEQDLRTRPGHIQQVRSFSWGKDLGGSDETILSSLHDKPLFVTEYPADIKAFYMKRADAGARVVRNFDLLAPEGYGEIIGGSQREDDPELLLARLRAEGLNPEDYQWYLDLRRYGTVPHGGFGLGIERILAWVCGLKHVRETIPFPRLLDRLYP